MAEKRCPDDGRCWHNCQSGCFRVWCCLPFSDHNGDGEWSEQERAEHGSYVGPDPTALIVVEATHG